jgi:hypothetical protein
LTLKIRALVKMDAGKSVHAYIKLDRIEKVNAIHAKVKTAPKRYFIGLPYYQGT